MGYYSNARLSQQRKTIIAQGYRSIATLGFPKYKLHCALIVISLCSYCPFVLDLLALFANAKKVRIANMP